MRQVLTWEDGVNVWSRLVWSVESDTTVSENTDHSQTWHQLQSLINQLLNMTRIRSRPVVIGNLDIVIDH